MSALETALADYLGIRRAMGFGLTRAEKLLGQFISFLEANSADTVTTELAVSWARAPAGAASWWHAMRLSTVRPFAVYLHTLDARAQVPPAGLIAAVGHRATPCLYTDAEITALMDAARRLPLRISRLTYPALIGILAATGMRIGEALDLEVGDFDAATGIITLRRGKNDKSRLLPLHPTATTALTCYLRERDLLRPAWSQGPLFISCAGTRVAYNTVGRTFRRLAERAGIRARSAACRPRIHDLRHSFAVASLLEAYRTGADVPSMLPRLATYLGHTDPKHTYWYLSAAPELLALAGDLLETSLGDTP
jgi:integrase